MMDVFLILYLSRSNTVKQFIFSVFWKVLWRIKQGYYYCSNLRNSWKFQDEIFKPKPFSLMSRMRVVRNENQFSMNYECYLSRIKCKTKPVSIRSILKWYMIQRMSRSDCQRNAKPSVDSSQERLAFTF